MATVNLNFHETFKPERQYIAAILEISDNTNFLSVKDISSQTGIPSGVSSGKVAPHIAYANYMGLIEYERKDSCYKLSKTKLGEVIFTEDPGLQEELTIWLCHCMMLRTFKGAPLWSCIFKKILPSYSNGIKKDMLFLELNKAFNGKVKTKNIAPFFTSYESFFDLLNILNNKSDNYKLSFAQYKKEYIFMYAYVLLEYWEENFLGQDEITSNQLDELVFGKVFGWDAKTEYGVLEHFSDKGILRLNRQLMPYTILKLLTKDDLINLLYTELY